MKPIVGKQDLLKILEENRKKHRTVYEKALQGFSADAEKTLYDQLLKVRDGDRDSILIHLVAPQDHTRDYDRAIRMVKLHQEDKIELSEQDAARYIEDDWGWKRDWIQNSTQYAAASVREFYEEI